MLGKKLEVTEIPRSHILALQRAQVNIENISVEYYQRVQINHKIIHSIEYKKPQKRRSYYVLLKTNEIFQINSFLVLKENNCSKCYAIGQYFLKYQNFTLVSNVKVKHLVPLQKLDNSLAAISIALIREKVTIIEIKHLKLMIACIHPNHCELLT